VAFCPGADTAVAVSSGVSSSPEITLLAGALLQELLPMPYQGVLADSTETCLTP
jgi:hypothetical protein